MQLSSISVRSQPEMIQTTGKIHRTNDVKESDKIPPIKMNENPYY